MNLDKRTILAFLLIGLVFLLVQSPVYKKLFFPKAYERELLQKEQQSRYDSQADSNEIEQELIEETVIKKDKPRSRVTLNAQEGEHEKLIKVSTDLFSAVMSNRGATLVEWSLKNYNGADKLPHDMIPSSKIGNLGLSFITREGDSINTALWNFSCEAPEEILLRDRIKKIRFVHQVDDNKKIVKEYEFIPGQYHFNLNVTIENFDNIIEGKAYSINAPTGLGTSEKRVGEDMSYTKAVVAASGEVNKGYKSNAKLYKEAGSIDWIATRTKYFALVIMPQNKKGMYASVFGNEVTLAEKGNEKWKKYSISLTMPYLKSIARDQYQVFLGPMDDEILKSYNVGLEKIMDRGAKIIQPFSVAILWTFKKIHSMVPNYGLVLIIFSILIKIVVWPLTHKSYESMRKMQALQPRLSELKEKYSKDPQRLNKETMKLYKEAGVNPMGGCLPILLQMPLLWALFIVFRSTIELRQQGFLWIADLSGPDTIANLPFSIPIYGNSFNILPLMMGLTMLLQQKLSVTDPKQKAMVYIMPIFMTLLFNNFPSGLNLYYTLFNILSIFQQKFLTGSKSKNLPAAATE